MGLRRSGRPTRVGGYQEDDDIEIVGDTEMDKKNAEKVDKNFSKMTLKGQREAMEAFRRSTLYNSDEEEEANLKKKLGAKKRKAIDDSYFDSDIDSDIEVLESPKPKKTSGSDLAADKEVKMSRRTNEADEKLLDDQSDNQKPEYVQVIT